MFGIYACAASFHLEGWESFNAVFPVNTPSSGMYTLDVTISA